MRGMLVGVFWRVVDLLGWNWWTYEKRKKIKTTPKMIRPRTNHLAHEFQVLLLLRHL